MPSKKQSVRPTKKTLKRGRGWFSDMLPGDLKGVADNIWNTVHPGSSKGKWYSDENMKPRLKPSAPPPQAQPKAPQPRAPPPTQPRAPPPQRPRAPPPQAEPSVEESFPSDIRQILADMRKAGGNPSDELKSRYRKATIKYHPDRNNGSEMSSNIMREMNSARGWGARKRGGRATCPCCHRP